MERHLHVTFLIGCFCLFVCFSHTVARMNRIRIHVLPSSRGRASQAARAQEPQTCAFTQRACTQPRIEGWDFCIKHILEDKNAPYRQCSYVSSKNAKRCPNAAPKPDKKDGYMFIPHLKHIRTVRVGRRRLSQNIVLMHADSFYLFYSCASHAVSRSQIHNVCVLQT